MSRYLIFVGYVSTVVLANWITSRYGLVAAGFALLVPAGTYAAGLALGLRDVLQDAAGVQRVLAAIGVGTAVSFLAGDATIAVASGIAFLLAEVADLAVYTPLRRKGWRRAILVKAVWCTVVVLAVREVARRALSRERLNRAGA